MGVKSTQEAVKQKLLVDYLTKYFKEVLDLEDDNYRELVKNVSAQLQKARLGDYIDLMQNPFRLIMTNFLAGIARGLGLAVGFTILGALILYFLQRLVILNLPIIGGVITEVVKLVKLNIR